MSIINDSHAIGIDTRNLVLKTRGSLHVKVGDRYYEIDFRNLNKDNSTKEKENYIFSIENENEIDQLEYPGDNKLIIGLDGSFFVTKNNEFVNITPKTQSSDSINTNFSQIPEITSLENVFIEGSLNGEFMTVDFANNTIDVAKLRVSDSIEYPKNTVTTLCCKSTETINNYQNYDFIELNHVLTKISLKSGVMIKSNISGTVRVWMSNVDTDITFEKGLYIIYLENKNIVYTKLT